jgi:3-oxoacyl-ACP reductase-like protein
MASDIPGERGARISLDGAVAVVTGASSGIGAATARALHERGARVVVAGGWSGWRSWRPRSTGWR